MSVIIDPNNGTGTRADLPITDPTLTASEVSLLKGILKQLQGTGSGRQPVINQNSSGGEIFTTANPGAVRDQSETLMTAPVSRIITLTETPVALNSKANLKQIAVRNTDAAIRARIGETGMTPANGKGFALEPGAICQEVFDPTIAVTIYGRSEGAAIQVEVYES